MPDFGFTFDANQVAPSAGPDPVPTGWYPSHITHSEIKHTKANDGAFLEFTCAILSGQYAGKTARDRLNLWNSSEEASRIAQGQLSAICHATGIYQVSNSDVFHGRPMDVYWVSMPAKDGYGPKNELKGFAPVGTKSSANVQPSAPAAAPAWAQQAPAQPNGAPAWSPPAAPQQAPPAAPPAPAGFAPPGRPGGFTPPAPVQSGPPGPPAAAAGDVPPWARPK